MHTAERLLVGIEEAVRGFPHYHKYTLGADLRHPAMRWVWSSGSHGSIRRVTLDAKLAPAR